MSSDRARYGSERAAAIREYKRMLRRYRWLRAVGDYGAAIEIKRAADKKRTAYNL